MNFPDFKAEHRRWAILKLLSDEHDRRCNHVLLRKKLPRWDHNVTLGTLEGDLKWLEQRGLVTVEELMTGYLAATVTDLGIAVAGGHERMRGVDFPIDPV